VKYTREEAIGHYYKILEKNPKKAREIIKKLDFKQDHYLLFCIANTYWEEDRKHNNKLRLTERYVTKAFKLNDDCLNDDCPFVLWLLGMVKWDYGQHDAAIFCFEDIIRMGVKGIINEGCANNKDVARAQINDSKFQLHRLYKTSNPALSKQYLNQFKKGLAHGAFTIIGRSLKEAGIVVKSSQDQSS